MYILRYKREEDARDLIFGFSDLENKPLYVKKTQYPPFFYCIFTIEDGERILDQVLGYGNFPCCPKLTISSYEDFKKYLNGFFNDAEVEIERNTLK